MDKYQTNLSEGSVLKRLVMFALPFFISNVIQSMYNVADMLIVGNYCGTASMSGVNIGGQVTFILTQIVVGFSVGGSVLIAQYIGSKNEEALKKTTSTLITFMLILAVATTAIMIFMREQVLVWIKTPAESYSETNDYLFVTVLGIIFIFGYNALSAILRGMGDSKRPLYFVTIACIVNVALDLLLVAKFKMGAKGAAIATVISQAVSMILCIILLKKSKFVFDFNLTSFKLDSSALKMIIKIGLPMSIQNGVTSISFLFITVMVNVLGGVTASAAVGAISKFNGFAIMPAVAMGSSVSTMAAQNIGANQWERAKKTAFIGIAFAFVISAAVFTLVQLFPEEILRLFDDDAAMVTSGVGYLRAMSYDYLIVPFVFCLNSLFTGAGHTTFSLISSMLSSLLLRIPMAYLLGFTLNRGLNGVAFAAPLATMGSLIIILIYYFSGAWRQNVVEKNAQKIDANRRPA